MFSEYHQPDVPGYAPDITRMFVVANYGCWLFDLPDERKINDAFVLQVCNCIAISGRETMNGATISSQLYHTPRKSNCNQAAFVYQGEGSKGVQTFWTLGNSMECEGEWD